MCDILQYLMQDFDPNCKERISSTFCSLHFLLLGVARSLLKYRFVIYFSGYLYCLLPFNNEFRTFMFVYWKNIITTEISYYI